MFSPSRYSATGSVFVVGLMVAAGPASAQSAPDSAAAQALFEQGKAMLAAGRVRDACPKFEESQRLDPGSGTLLNLARCYEEEHRVASAWTKYLEAAAAAKATGNAERENEARQQAARLRPHLANLVIAVPAEVSALRGLEIVRDGEPVGTPQWGLPIPADEGEHSVVVKAPGYLPWQSAVIVKRETTTTLNVRALQPDLQSSAPLAVSNAAPSPARVPPESRGGTQRAFSLVAGVVGVVGAGVGVGFGLTSKTDHDRAAKYCNGGTCTDPRGVTATHDAYSAGNIATAGAIVGAVGLVSALTLWLTAPSSRSEAPAQVSVGLGTLQVRRAF
ncbi:MAG TPA: hypothetical protein VGI10_28665 [Polyangiaceae bacterium]